jgi:hypothetical protein
VDAIRIMGSGSYPIAHNSIDCGWPGGVATGIDVFAQASPPPEAGAIIAENDITMSAPAALMVIRRSEATPRNNRFVSNDVGDFQPPAANVFVEVGSTNTVIVGPQTSLEEHGIGAVVVPMPQ